MVCISGEDSCEYVFRDKIEGKCFDVGFGVMLVAVNELCPIGGEHVSRALMQLTGLQALNLSSACLLC